MRGFSRAQLSSRSDHNYRRFAMFHSALLLYRKSNPWEAGKQPRPELSLLSRRTRCRPDICPRFEALDDQQSFRLSNDCTDFWMAGVRFFAIHCASRKLQFLCSSARTERAVKTVKTSINAGSFAGPKNLVFPYSPSAISAVPVSRSGNKCPPACLKSLGNS